MSFDIFNGIEQSTANSCGAYALAAALENFGLAQQTHQANLLNTANLATGYSQAGPAVSNTEGAGAFAASIYQVTGNLLLSNTAIYEYLVPVSDMNPPSALVYVATLFGYSPNHIAVRYTNAGMATFDALQVTNNGTGGSLLNTEIDLLTIINQNQGMIIVGPVNYNGIPDATHVQIVLVQNGQHWIAVNNAQLYDPGTGYVGAYQLVDNEGQLSFDYEMADVTHENDFSGIWIELRAKG
jgi:hypothetical protein